MDTQDCKYHNVWKYHIQLKLCSYRNSDIYWCEYTKCL